MYNISIFCNFKHNHISRYGFQIRNIETLITAFYAVFPQKMTKLSTKLSMPINNTEKNKNNI